MTRWLTLFLLLIAPATFGANAITVGTMVLTPTFQNIGAVASYTGDDDGDATFASYWRKTGQTLWRTNYHNTNLIDRAATRGGFNNSSNQFQARFSVLGTLPNTSYEVRIDWTDPDGGSANITNTITTLAYSDDVPTNGTIITCTSSDTLSTKINALNAGETLSVETATYAGNFTVTVSGTPTAWIVIRNAAGNTPTVGGGAFLNNINITGRSNIVFSGFTFNAAQERTFNIGAGCRYMFIQNCIADAIGSVEGDFNCFATVGECTNIYFLNNGTINGRDATPASDTHGIQFDQDAAFTIICQSNNFANWWDSIGGGGNYGIRNGVSANCDFIGNVFGPGTDDRAEFEGDGINNRIIGNYGYGGAEDFIGIAPILVGPTYLIYNRCNMTNGSGLKQGNNSGACHVIAAHNTFSTIGSSSGGFATTGEWGGASNEERHWYLNNIFEARGNAIDGSGQTNYYDYNAHRSTTGTIVNAWNGGATTYDTLADFQSGTIMEDHGVSANADIINYVTHEIDSDSPCKDAGVVINGINDLYSRWPFGGSAPDIGAYEINPGTWDQGNDAGGGGETVTGTALRPGNRGFGRKR